jgi:two-component system LytT family response regulator
MRVLIIDDEPLAQVALANVLSNRQDIDAYDVAADAVEALEKLARQAYDVLLLDINMPEISGIDMLDQIKWREHPVQSIVFVTAHAEHALAAFKKHAVDYVLKPFSRERIDAALDAALHRSSLERAAKLVEDMPQLQKLLRRPFDKIAIKAKGRILFIDPNDIIAVHAEGNYVLLQREADSYLLRESISVMAEKLKQYGFIRIHRSVLINSALVEEIEPRPTGEYGLRLRGGKQYTVTRSYKKNLKDLAASWIGVESFTEE